MWGLKIEKNELWGQQSDMKTELNESWGQRLDMKQKPMNCRVHDGSALRRLYSHMTLQGKNIHLFHVQAA